MLHESELVLRMFLSYFQNTKTHTPMLHEYELVLRMFLYFQNTWTHTPILHEYELVLRMLLSIHVFPKHLNTHSYAAWIWTGLENAIIIFPKHFNKNIFCHYHLTLTTHTTAKEVSAGSYLATLLPPSPRTVLSLSCFKVLQSINCRD